MKLIKYLFRKFMLPVYIIISAVISIIFTLVAGADFSVFLRMLPVVLCLLLLLRASDDLFDYETDSTKKTQHLSKKALIILASVIALLYISLNVAFYGLIGLISIAAVVYIPIQEKLPMLKIAYMALLFLYYFYANCTALIWIHFAAAVVCLIVSAVYYIFKRKVRK